MYVIESKFQTKYNCLRELNLMHWWKMEFQMCVQKKAKECETNSFGVLWVSQHIYPLNLNPHSDISGILTKEKKRDAKRKKT